MGLQFYGARGYGGSYWPTRWKTFAFRDVRPRSLRATSCKCNEMQPWPRERGGGGEGRLIKRRRKSGGRRGRVLTRVVAVASNHLYPP